MAETLAEWVASGSEVTEEDTQRAREALDAIGAPALLDALEMAEGIIRFGNCFHSVAAFFAAGSAEQRYVLRVTDPSREH